MNTQILVSVGPITAGFSQKPAVMRSVVISNSVVVKDLLLVIRDSIHDIHLLNFIFLRGLYLSNFIWIWNLYLLYSLYYNYVISRAFSMDFLFFHFDCDLRCYSRIAFNARICDNIPWVVFDRITSRAHWIIVMDFI